MSKPVPAYLDRFEGDAAVILIDGREAIVPASMLPDDVREGDHLVVAIALDSAARKRTSEEILKLQKEMKPKDEID